MSKVDASALAEALIGSTATRELVPMDPALSARWHEHDYPSVYARWNYHPEYEVHLTRRTSGHYIVGDHVGVFEPGQLILVGPYVPHDWISDTDEFVPLRDAVFQFRDDWLDRCQEVLPEIAALDRLRRDARFGIVYAGAAARDGVTELEAIGSTRGARRVAHIFGLFAVLAGAESDEHRLLTASPAPIPPGTSSSIDAVMQYILANAAGGDIRMSTAAEIAGLSPAAFSRFFSRVSGQRFSDIVRKLRLAHACRLLRQTDRPIADIAFDAGYTNLSNFNRQFLTQFGCTPRDYRRLEDGAVPGVPGRVQG